MQTEKRSPLVLRRELGPGATLDGKRELRAGGDLLEHFLNRLLPVDCYDHIALDQRLEVIFRVVAHDCAHPVR